MSAKSGPVPAAREPVQSVNHGGGDKARITEPLPLAEALAELLELSGERDQWMDRLGAEYRLGFRLGYAAGIEAGRCLEAADAAQRDDARNWPGRPVIRFRDSLADLEAVRWSVRGEPRTRETYGNPHPDDYRGHEVGHAASQP